MARHDSGIIARRLPSDWPGLLAFIAPVDDNATMQVRCPNCHDSTEVDDDTELSNIACNSCGGEFSLVGEETIAHDQATAKTIGHFELVDQLGVGTFGSVWMARDTQLDRSVAVKIPRNGQLDPGETEQFIREARAAAQLKHPNIVAVHEVGREDGQVYIVSDYVEGLTLADWLVGQQLTSRLAAELCVKLAEALHHAHEAGVIHRDLKPTNIIIDSENEPHVMDFGLAKREAGEVTMTMEGKVLGTPAYMSPEQAKGEAHQADRRSDVYSLGVILYELLTGHKPFRGNVRMLLQQVINEEPHSPRKLNSSVPLDMETICLKCLEKDPRKRYSSAKNFADELRRFLAGEPIEARPVTSPEKARRWCRRNPVVAGLGLALAAVLLILSIVGPVVAIRQTRLASEKTQLADEKSQLAEKTRRLLYVSDMNVALQEWDEGNVEGVVALLKRHEPQEGEEDLRGFAWYHVWHLCNRPLKAPTLNHERRVTSVAFSVDGTTLASATGNLVTIWDVGTYKSEAIIQRGANGVSFSPDRKFLAFSDPRSRTVTLWNTQSGEQEHELKHDAAVWCVEFSPNGLTLASGSGYGDVTFWSVATGKKLDTFQGDLLETSGISGWRAVTIAFSPDSRRFASGSSDRTVRLWDVNSREELDKLTAETNIKAIDFSSDGDTIAVRTEDKVLLWHWEDKEQRQLLVEDIGEGWGTVAFSPNDKALALKAA